MFLRHLVREHARARDLSPGTTDAYWHAVLSLERYAGKKLKLGDLNSDLLNAWADARLAEKRQKITVRNQLCAVLTLWRSTKADDKLPADLRRVRRLRVPRPVPEAWYPDQLNALLEAAGRLQGVHKRSGVEWAKLARVWLLVGYYSGLRGCDLLQLPLRSALSSRPFVVRQSKTDWPITVTLPADAIEAVRATVPPEREKLLPLHRSTLYCLARDVCRLAGIDGSPKWLRKTGATAVEIETPGGAMAYLGHKTPGLAYKHYVDQRQVGLKRPRPPAIE